MIKTANELERSTSPLIAALHGTLPKFENTFPGISAAISPATTEAELGQIFSKAAEQAVGNALQRATGSNLSKSLASSELQLNEMLAVVRELRAVVASNGDPLLRQAKDLMGKNMIGPEASIFLGKDIGPVPNLPEDILQTLSEACPLANNGKTVAQTHRLVLLPAKIDGERFTVEMLRGEFPKLFDTRELPRGDTHSVCFPSSSSWALMYESPKSKLINRQDSQQERIVKKLNNYRSAFAFEAVAVLVFNAVENQERLSPDVYGRCEDRGESNERIGVGNSKKGIRIRKYQDDIEAPVLGRFLVRKFS